mgnify:CR=1 FL=1
MNNSIELVMNAVRNAHEQMNNAKEDPTKTKGALNYLDYAEELLTEIQLDPQNIEDRYRLQQATDVVKALRENQ